MKDKLLRRIIRKTKSPFKALKLYLKKKLGWLGVPLIIPYVAYGNSEKVFIQGAVIEDKGLVKPEKDQPLWKNILTMIKRYSGDEIAGVRVQINYMDIKEVVRTDERGIFQTSMARQNGFPEDASRDVVYLTLLDKITEGQQKITSEINVQSVSAGADFIVVSDIDDTVMISHSTQIIKKLRLMLSKNAFTRTPFAGVASFYHALKDGGAAKRPVFYVSSSEWNLYDLLRDFFIIKGMPAGSLLLSDKKLKPLSLWHSGNKHDRKITHIKTLFEFFIKHDFILLGDSGQDDPEIYLEIAEMFPSRVKAIYIRYAGKRKRNERLKALIEEAGELDTEMLAVRNTVEAAEHAVKRGYINQDRLEKIRMDKKIDNKNPSTKN